MRRGRTGEGADHWPGFVDALATLLLVTIFLLSLFAVAQYAVGAALSSKDRELESLNQRLASLAEQLALAEASKVENERKIGALEASLETAEAKLVIAEGELSDAQETIVVVRGERDSAEALSEQAQDQIALLNQQVLALRQQLAALNAALEAAEALDAEQKAQIENLSSRLNSALARKVQQMAEFRSKFFEELTTALGDRTDIRVVGDRFVFETDVLFDSGSAELAPAGTAELIKIANVIKDVARDIPSDVDWIIRVDGHTDRVPIRDAYASNWELSAARAISVVNYFEALGVPSKRLVAAGFGEHHPIATGSSQAALTRNRRIELKLDSR